ncbi:hypothetical protein XM38_024640 [Halomicronema hongdechloris C2206]|uniref:TIGR02588 family protein n=1 Tax=Halomicronema hongdechloris C2206 TaxID=1641165 RepID=A0A1Z3HMH3_9CYAN|nr:TIGR02588 family protein [Halomicronema hongdechloris]ASC71512.1 hypothetical protein XM38_024640 [Halomicronema hongdechloris C2206]
MSESVNPPNPRESSPPSGAEARSLAEWLTFALATSILIGLVALVMYDWHLTQHRPPAFQVDVTADIRETDGHYYVPFAITNTGGHIARTVQVTAELQLEGIPNETGEQQIDFLSGNERKQGSFVFTHDPQTGDLMVRVASYGLP